MGKVLMGSTERKGDINLLTPQQQEFLSSILGQVGPQAAPALQSIISPETEGPLSDRFQKSSVDPALLYFNKEIAPAIKEQFLGGDSKGSSALDQALSQSASDLSTMLGSQYSDYLDRQKQMQLQGLGLLGGLGTQRTFEPFLQQRQGLAGPLLGAAGAIGGGFLGGPAGAGLGSILFGQQNMPANYYGR